MLESSAPMIVAGVKFLTAPDPLLSLRTPWFAPNLYSPKITMRSSSPFPKQAEPLAYRTKRVGFISVLAIVRCGGSQSS